MMTGVVVVVRWIVLVPATVLGAVVFRYLFYLVMTSFLGGENLFTGLPVGTVFAFAVGYFGMQIAPAYKRGVAAVLLGLLGLFAYRAVGGAVITLVRGDGVSSWFTLGENVAVAATASMLLAELARGKTPFTTTSEPKIGGKGGMTNGPKPQIRITLESVQSANDPGFSAAVHELVDGSWKPVVDDGSRPMELTHSTKEGARQRALTALNNLFGENCYDLV